MQNARNFSSLLQETAARLAVSARVSALASKGCQSVALSAAYNAIVWAWVPQTLTNSLASSASVSTSQASLPLHSAKLPVTRFEITIFESGPKCRSGARYKIQNSQPLWAYLQLQRSACQGLFSTYTTSRLKDTHNVNQWLHYPWFSSKSGNSFFSEST